MAFRDTEYERQAAFRRASPAISADARSPTDEPGRRYGYMLALGHEDQNLYPSLRGGSGARRFMERRGIRWWRHSVFDRPGVSGPTRNMASSQIVCINFLLPLASMDGALVALLRAIDDDMEGLATIEDTVAGTNSPVEFEWIGLGHALEGESVTTRGAVSTSIDAFAVAETARGRRAYLIEWKYAESYGSEDKGAGPSGEARRARYSAPYVASRAFAKDVPLDAWLYEPFYQIVRQRLLADRMVVRREHGVKEAKVVVVVPEGQCCLSAPGYVAGARGGVSRCRHCRRSCSGDPVRPGTRLCDGQPASPRRRGAGHVRRCRHAVVPISARPVRVVRAPSLGR